jgi:putative NADH-flavin reductase
MKLVVIGATGRSGRRLVDRAVEAGHTVTAFAPEPAKLGDQSERLITLAGDVLDAGAVKEAIMGSEAVVSALGVAKRTTTTLFSDGIRNIVAAMDASGVRRLVCVSAAGLAIGPHLGLPRQLFAEFVIERIMRNVYLDLARMEDEVALSDLDYTVVRAGRLTEGPYTGTYRTAVNASIRRPGPLSRADLAGYVLGHLGAQDTYRAVVEVAY